jgi:hypothetical protein
MFDKILVVTADHRADHGTGSTADLDNTYEEDHSIDSYHNMDFVTVRTVVLVVMCKWTPMEVHNTAPVLDRDNRNLVVVAVDPGTRNFVAGKDCTDLNPQHMTTLNPYYHSGVPVSVQPSQ